MSATKLKGFINETLVYGFGNVFSRFFAMLLIPLYSSYLGKIDYSNIVMLQSTFAILSILLSLTGGVFYYYYEYDNLKYRKMVLTSWFYYEVVITIIISIILFFVSQYLSGFFVVNANNTSQIRWAIVLIGLQLFPYIFNSTNINYFRIERKPKSVVLIVLLESLFTVILVLISLRYLKLGIIGVLVSQLGARTIVSLLFMKYSILYMNVKYFSIKLLKKIFDYCWPFIVSSMFTWIIISVDKFIGAKELIDPTEVALLALAMQLVLPMSVLADMIRMAIGPYVMSIRKDSDAEKSYQQIFDLTIFAASIAVVGLVLISPVLIIVLADKTYMQVVYIIPLMAFAQLISLIGNQFCISFSLVKKNTHILYSIVLAGIVGVVINFLFMHKFGYITSGFSQIASYVIMSLYLLYFGKKVANLQIKLKNSFILISIILIYLIALQPINKFVMHGEYIILIIYSLVFLVVITFSYMKQQKLNLGIIYKLIHREKNPRL